MILERIKKIWNSRVGMASICFIVGGLIGYWLMPEKNTVKIETVTVFKDKIIEKVVTKWKTKVVYKDKEIKKTKHTVIMPNGTTTIDEIYESNTQQVSRLDEQYKDALSQRESEWNQKYSYLKQQIGRKRIMLFGGVGTNVSSINKLSYQAGMSADIFGPINIGISGTSQADVFMNLGIKF